MPAADERYRIPFRFTVVPNGPDEFRVHSLTFSVALRDDPGGILSRLLPLLDGARTVHQIVTELGEDGEEAVVEALEALIDAGVVENVSEEAFGLSTAEVDRYTPQSAFFDHFIAPAPPDGAAWDGGPRSGVEHQARLKSARVLILGLGRLGSQVAHALAVAGVGTIIGVDGEPVGRSSMVDDSLFGPDDEGLPRGQALRRRLATANEHLVVQTPPEPTGPDDLKELLSGSDIAVLCRDHVNPAEFQMFNDVALGTRTPWTSGRPSGFEFQIGPTVIPGETACWTCFDRRLKSNVPDLSEYRVLQEFLSGARLRQAALAFTPGANLLALEVVKAITWFMAPATSGRLYRLNLLTMESTFHPVLKLPRCPACGRPGQHRPTIHAWQQSSSARLP